MPYRLAIILGVYAASIAAAWFGGVNYKSNQVETRAAKEIAKSLERVREVERESVESERAIVTEAARRERLLEARYRDAVGRVGPVRVCVSPPTGLPDAAGAAGSDPATAGRNELPATPGRDIAPDLIELTRLADKQAAQILACNQYADAMDRYLKSQQATF